MRRRLKKTAPPGVSLFPFLAVLICTLGVLIVLLVLAVQSASTSAATEAAESADNPAKNSSQARLQDNDPAEDSETQLALHSKQADRIEDLQAAIDLREIQAEGLTEIRPEITDRLAEARDYRAHLENEIEKINSDAEQLAAQLKLLSEKTETTAENSSLEEIDSLRDRVATAKKTLAQKRSSVKTIVDKKYSIVPYHGTGGTKRQPVFIECLGDSIVIQPYNIRLTQEDFAHPIQAGNPIDAALLTVRNYTMKYNLSDSDQRPYPLLVVRPEGAQAYGLARRSMNSWSDEFGYELVEAGKELDFGRADPQLETEIRDAVEKAKRTQRALNNRRAALARSRGLAGSGDEGYGEGSSAGSYRASSQRGGSLQTGGFQNSQSAFDEFASSIESSSARNDASNRESKQLTGSNGQRSRNQQTGRFSQASFAKSSDAKLSDAESSDATSAADSNVQSGQGSVGNGTQQSLANERGANWALPTQTAGATGYVRPVSVRCSGNQLEIRNVAKNLTTIDLGEDATKGIDRMINIVWQRIDAWGIAGANAYWKPALEVTVDPGGEATFRQLQNMLRGSGLNVQRVQP